MGIPVEESGRFAARFLTQNPKVAGPPPLLDPEAADAIADLCGRALLDPPSAGEIRQALFDPARPAVVRGDPATGVAATVVRRGEGYLRLLAVDPPARRAGLGSALLTAAEADVSAAGCGSLRTGADAPDYLLPGVDVRLTPMLALLERRGYRRADVTFNMDVDLAALDGLAGPEPASSVRAASPADRDRFAEWLRRHWPNWEDEALRGLDQGTAVLSDDGDRDIAGFCAWDVNRRGWLGPMAVRPGVGGRGWGRDLLLAALAAMRASGLGQAQIAWVGPIGFYAGAAGAHISRVFFVYERRL